MCHSYMLLPHKPQHSHTLHIHLHIPHSHAPCPPRLYSCTRRTHSSPILTHCSCHTSHTLVHITHIHSLTHILPSVSTLMHTLPPTHPQNGVGTAMFCASEVIQPPPQISTHAQSRGLLGGFGHHRQPLQFVKFLDQNFSL